MKPELVRFKSHPHPFGVTSFQCDEPMCDCGEVSFELCEQSDAESAGEGLRFSLIVDPETWQELRPPDRPAQIAGFVQEFLRDFPVEERAAFLETLRKKRQVSQRLREYRMSPAQLSGQLVSFNEIIRGPDESREASSYTYSFRHDGTVYLVEDLYCGNPDCRCREVMLSFFQYTPSEKPDGAARAEQIAMARLSLDGALKLDQHFVCARETAEGVLAAWKSRFDDDIGLLKLRYEKVKEIAGRSPRPRVGGLSARSILGLPGRSLAGKIGRNDPCPCGSGRKYKKCCGR